MASNALSTGCNFSHIDGPTLQLHINRNHTTPPVHMQFQSPSSQHTLPSPPIQQNSNLGACHSQSIEIAPRLPQYQGHQFQTNWAAPQQVPMAPPSVPNSPVQSNTNYIETSKQWPLSTQQFLQGLIVKHGLHDPSQNPQARDVLARLYDDFYSGTSFQGHKPAKNDLQFQQTFRAHIDLLLRGMRPQIQKNTAPVGLGINQMSQSMRRIPHQVAMSPLTTPPTTPLLHQQPEVVLPVTAPVLQKGPSTPTTIPSPIIPQEPGESLGIAMIANFWNAMDAEDQTQVLLKIMATAKDPNRILLEWQRQYTEQCQKSRRGSTVEEATMIPADKISAVETQQVKETGPTAPPPTPAVALTSYASPIPADTPVEVPVTAPGPTPHPKPLRKLRNIEELLREGMKARRLEKEKKRALSATEEEDEQETKKAKTDW